jgi:hypothetical protein
MKFTVDVEEIAFGKVFRTLDAMPGVISIKIVGDGPRSQQQPATSGRPRAAAILLQALSAAPRGQMARGDLEAVLAKNGRSKKSFPGTLFTMEKQKLLRRSARGKIVTMTPAGAKKLLGSKPEKEK